MSAKSQKRFYIKSMGEYFDSILKLEAILYNKTMSEIASSLLVDKLKENEPERKKMIEQMAIKNGVSYEEQYRQLMVEAGGMGD